MPSLDKRVTKLEDAVIKHLTESGEMRQSLQTLTKAVEKISNRMWSAMVASISVLVAVVGFLLKVSLWR
jgi:hypothetical protein